MKIRLAITLLFMLFATQAQAQVQAWLVPATVKVFPDTEYVNYMPCDSASFRVVVVFEADKYNCSFINTARNEYASFQIALRSETDINNVSVIFEESLISINEPYAMVSFMYIKLPVDLLLVENVNITKPSMSGKAGLWPDPLPPYHSFDLKAGVTRAVWVDIYIPSDAKAISYPVNISIEIPDQEPIKLSYGLYVHDITIPTEPHINTAFGIGYGDIAESHGVVKDSPEHQALKIAYYNFLLEHRLSPYFLPVDFYSDEAATYMNDPRVTFLRAPFSWDPMEMKRIDDRLRDNGWIDKAYFYNVDEPDHADFENVNNIGKHLHAIDPDLKMLLTYRYTPELDPAGIQVYCPVITYTISPPEIQALKKQQRLGRDFWWYTCIQPKWEGTTYFIDDTATAPRMHPWLSALYGVTGILYWQTTHWGAGDPWVNTETYPGGNGDGSLLYPGKNVGYDGPVASIRLKMLREGMEDYELLHLLREALAQTAATLGADGFDPDARIREHAFNLLTPEGRANPLGGNTPYPMFVVKDGAAIDARRLLVMQEIEAERQAPPVLAETKPIDGGYTSKDEAEVSGWMEPGATVIVNEKPAQTKGNKFRAKVPLQPGENKILITVESNGKTRTITRTVNRK